MGEGYTGERVSSLFPSQLVRCSCCLRNPIAVLLQPFFPADVLRRGEPATATRTASAVGARVGEWRWNCYLFKYGRIYSLHNDTMSTACKLHFTASLRDCSLALTFLDQGSTAVDNLRQEHRPKQTASAMRDVDWYSRL